MMFALVIGCGSIKPDIPHTAPVAPAMPRVVATAARDPAAPPAPREPAPAIGPWGFDLGGMDRSVAPGADFARYASGQWQASTPIPDDKALYTMFTALADLSSQRTRDIIESASGAPGSDGQRIGDYYRSFMDEAAIEARGLAAIQPRLVTDAHSPVGLRAATVRNLDAWYDAFAPRPGDALYLPPDQRVRIW